MEANVAISDALWDPWLAASVAGSKGLLTTWGDIQPTKEQWRRATRMMRDAGCKVAVVTESRVASALAKAASWAGADMQAFRWEQLFEAMGFLSLDGQRRVAVRTSTMALRDYFGPVDGSQPPAPVSPAAMARPPISASPASPSPAMRPTPSSISRPAARLEKPQRVVPMRSGAGSSRAEASRTPMADAAAKNLAQVRQTSEEIQAKLAEIQARLRNRTRS